MQDKTLLWWEEKKCKQGGESTGGRRGFIGIGARPLSSLDRLLSSGIMDYSVQAGPLLVLHVSLISIMGTAFRVSHASNTHTHTHTSEKKHQQCCKQLSIRPS